VNKDSISELPRARKENLIVKEVDGEVLVYDLNNDKAHCLNQTAARIWQYCDGSRSVAEIAELMSTPGEMPVADPVVLLALDQLQKFELLERSVNSPPHLLGMSRRQMIRLVGTAAIAVPVITTIVSPSSAHAQSLLAPGACCGSPGQCASNSCNQTPTCVGLPQPSTKACA